MTRVSAILPCFNEAENLPIVYQRLAKVAAEDGGAWEFLFIDDHSTDDTPRVLRELAAADPRVKSLRFSRNFGSHAAIAAGFAHCTGEVAAVLAADGQDPPEEIPRLLAKWREHFRIVWAVRARREDTFLVQVTSRAYWMIMRRIAMPNMPPAGADMLLLDRQVIDIVNRIEEKNTSILGVVLWTGFDQAFVEYHKQARIHGETKWTLGKKVKLALDSLVSFSYLPIRWMSAVGFGCASLGMLYAVVLVFRALVIGEVPQGWTSLMCVLLVVSGIQMMMLGLLGEYLWRTLDESRGRPRYVVADRLNVE